MRTARDEEAQRAAIALQTGTLPPSPQQTQQHASGSVADRVLREPREVVEGVPLVLVHDSEDSKEEAATQAESQDPDYHPSQG